MKKFLLIYMFLISLLVAKDIYSKPFIQISLKGDIQDFKTTNNYVVINNFIYDKKNGKVLEILKDFRNIVDINDTLVVFNSNKGIVFLDLVNNKVTKTIKGDFYKGVLNKDNLIYISNLDSNKVVVHNLKTNKRKIIKTPLDYEIENFSKNYIIYFSEGQKSIKIKDINKNKTIRIIKNKYHLFSNDKYIVLEQQNKNSSSIEIRDIKTNKLYKTFKIKSSEYAEIKDVSNDVVVLSKSSKLLFWDIKKKKFKYKSLSTKNGEEDEILGLDGNLLYFNYGDVYNLLTQKRKHKFKGVSQNINIDFNGKYIVAVKPNGKKIYIFDIENGRLYKTIKAPKSFQNAFVSFKGDYLIVFNDSNYQIFNFKTNKLLKTIPIKMDEDDKVNPLIEIYKDELALAYKNKKIKVWNLKNNKLIHTYNLRKVLKKDFTIDEMVFNKNYIALGNQENNKLLLFNRKSKKITLVSNKYSYYGYYLEMDDKNLIFGYNDTDKKTKHSITRVVKWNLKKKKIQEELAHSMFPETEANLRDIKKDYVVYEFEDESMGIYNRKTNKEIKSFPFYLPSFIIKKDKVVYLKNGIYLYDLKKNKYLLTSYILDNKNWLSITPEGYYVGTKGAKKYLNITKFTKDGMKIATNPQLYNFYNRPDLVELKLRGDEKAYKRLIQKLKQQKGEEK